MVFSSQVFLFYFLPLVFICYFAMPKRGKNVILTLLSYLFYGFANPSFVFLMLGTTIVNYVCGLVIAGRTLGGSAPAKPLEKGGPRTRRQKVALAVSVSASLLALAFFKYFNFGVENYNALVTALGLGHLQWE